MKAISIIHPGEAYKLEFEEYPLPEPVEHQVRIRVVATALNRADLMQMAGRYPIPPGVTHIPGLEVAGVVDKVGDEVTLFRPGDRVCTLLDGGGYAEFAVTSEAMVMPVPDQFDATMAAAVPEVFLTAWQALFWLANLGNGENVLIHAGASGVGTAAIQLAKVFCDANVAVTAGSKEKLQFCSGLGADITVNYKEEEFSETITSTWKDSGANVVLDFIGAPYWNQNLEVLGMDGRMVVLAMLGGARDELGIGKILRKRLTVMGSTLRNRSRRYKEELTKDFTDHVPEQFRKGTLRPVVDSVFNWQEINEAVAHMAANKNIGKIVLQVSGE